VSDIYHKINVAVGQKLSLAICTIVNSRGSTPRKTGAKMLVYQNGEIYGTIGGGALEKEVVHKAKEVIKKGIPELFRHDLLHQHQMCCGGTVEIYIEPIMSKSKLYIFGAGHTGQALAKYAEGFDFDVILIDDRKEYMDACKLTHINKMHLDFKEALSLLPFDENTYVAIMTYDHAVDRDILLFCIKKPHAYLGMIGSKRKVEVTKKMFTGLGRFSNEELSKIDMPMGIDILAEGPHEIAISIMAKLIKVKHTQKNEQKGK